MTKGSFFIFSLFAILATAFALSCESGWTEREGKCYRFQSKILQTWDDAEAACVSTGGHLVSIESEGENIWLAKWWVSQLPSDDILQYIWTGFTDKVTEGTWIWSDGSPSTFTQWGGRQPNGGVTSNCATMVTRYPDANGKWDDARCAVKRAYVCETSQGAAGGTNEAGWWGESSKENKGWWRREAKVDTNF